MPPAAREATPDRHARNRAAQHESWVRDPHKRHRALALGNVRALLERHPEDLSDVLDAIAKAVKR